ncbi:hypothetical protein [Marinobacter sp. F4206]|uniref:hypothetical protein n=1 Tax=Marinobacter sp. F4206 TaxID=2861777 RepID=UPI001C5F58AC|nr:hypothetical protein [Marinobacter sp. F4206]MBW4936203.1 hypothetical protein [Marinobacter sp. F4206]
MYLKKLAVAMTGILLLFASTGIGWAHETTDHQPIEKGLKTVPEPAGKTTDSGVTVIERTLGKGPVGTIVVRQGATVRLVLHAPVGVELHLHGYDLSGVVDGEAPVVMSFRANHTGRFPIEAHGMQDLLGRTDSALAYLEVRPE